MKIIKWELIATYEDGDERDISLFIPMRLGAEIERLLDYLEADDIDEDNNRE
jgi:hypothetical protein